MGYRFVGVVGLLLLLIAIEDWRRLLLAAGPWKVSVVSNSMKFLVMLATVLFSFFSGGKGINKGDERRFQVIYGLIFVADCCFFMERLETVVLGIGVFMVVQLLLIRRNYSSSSIPSDRTKQVAVALLAYLYFVPLAAMNVLFFLVLGLNILQIEIAVYSVLLYCSVMTSLLCLVSRNAVIPFNNALLMFLGLTFFCVCDLTVMGTLLQDPESIGSVFTTSLTWMFYGPALALIALSIRK